MYPIKHKNIGKKQMEKTNVLVSLVFLLAVVLSMSLVFADDTETADNNISIITANESEFHTLTPSISIIAIGNCSSYYVNLTSNSTVVVNDTTIQNNTLTTITFTTLTARNTYLYNLTLWNESCASQINDSVTYILEINGRPSITSVTTDDSCTIRSQDRLFSTVWSDLNASNNGKNDSVKQYVCKTNEFSGGTCTGGSWCTESTYQTDATSSCTATIDGSSTTGSKDYYVFLRDNNNSDISGAVSGVFTICGGSEWDEEDTGSSGTFSTSEESSSDSPRLGISWALVILIAVIIVVVIALIYASKKRTR